MSAWREVFEITNKPFTAIIGTYDVGTNKYYNIKRLDDADYLAKTSKEQKEKDAAEMRRLAKLLLNDVLSETSGNGRSSDADADKVENTESERTGFYPDGETTDIAAQSEDFDRGPEAVGYFAYYNSYFRRSEDYKDEGIEKQNGVQARAAVQSLLEVKYKIDRFRNLYQSDLSCTNRCLIYSKLPAMKINRSDAEKVASFFFVSIRSIVGVIHAALKDDTERANVLMSDYEDWITSKDPHYPVLTMAQHQAADSRMTVAHGKARNPDYNLSAMLYQDSQVMARACALQVKYTPDMDYDFVKDKIDNNGFAYFLIRLARISALEAIADCRKHGIPCIDPLLRFELADEAIGDTEPDLIHGVLENYWRAYFGAKALYMGFRNGTVLKDRFAEDLEKADGGDAEAQNEMGKRYLSGNGVAKDYDRAYAWFQKSAARGNAKAMNNLGVCHMNGWGVEADAKAGCEYFEKAAELGLAMAQVKVGKMWLNGFTFKGGYAVTNDVKRGFEWLRKAALQKDPEAAFQMWRCYEEGIAVQKDSRKALEWLNSAVELNHSDAQFKLAEKYEYGNGCEKDIVKAYKLFQESAKQGNSKALNSLGLWYQRGTFVAKDYRKAAELFSKSAKQGDHWGEYMMAVCYESGSGVKMNYAKAAELMGKAAKCDFAPSMVGLARYYEQGIGVQKDKVEALKWYVKAVQNENIYDEQKKEAQLAIERLEPNAKKMQSDASKK